MQTRTFTVEEANSMIPELKAMFEMIFFLNARVRELSRDVDNFLEIWGRDVLEMGHQDHEEYVERVQQRAGYLKQIQGIVNRIREKGAMVKGMNKGLVDFCHEKDGELVYLCWEYGEPEVKWWHRPQDGYNGRRPVSELKSQNGL